VERHRESEVFVPQQITRLERYALLGPDVRSTCMGVSDLALALVLIAGRGRESGMKLVGYQKFYGFRKFDSQQITRSEWYSVVCSETSRDPSKE
jgi:hypothetical protein